MLSITFNDEAHDSAARTVEGMLGLQVEITYTPGTTPYCENPVEIIRIDPDGDVVVSEVNDDGFALRHSTWAIPLNIIERVHVL